MSLRLLWSGERLLLKIQSIISVPQGLIFGLFRPKTPLPEGFIYGQGSLKGRRLYLAKAENTACEVIAVHNALTFSGVPSSYESVRSAFMSSGALTLWPLGFFGGNPYSIKRVLKRFGISARAIPPKKIEDEIGKTGPACLIISFFNPGSLSLHTVFCELRGRDLYAYNLFSGSRSPQKIEVGKMRRQILRAWALEEDGSRRGRGRKREA